MQQFAPEPAPSTVLSFLAAMHVYIYIYIYVFSPLFSSPVASCAGVSQASSLRLCNARSGRARLKREEERKADEA